MLTNNVMIVASSSFVGRYPVELNGPVTMGAAAATLSVRSVPVSGNALTINGNITFQQSGTLTMSPDFGSPTLITGRIEDWADNGDIMGTLNKTAMAS